MAAVSQFRRECLALSCLGMANFAENILQAVLNGMELVERHLSIHERSQQVSGVIRVPGKRNCDLLVVGVGHHF